MARVAPALCALVAAFALMGCEVRGRVDVAMQRDGNGTVTVSLTLDREAVARIGDLAAELETADLEAVGWRVAPLEQRGDLTVVAATKPVRSPADLQRVLRQVGAGLFAGWRFGVDRGFGTLTWRLGGTVSAAGSLEQFSDADLAAALDGMPLGRTPEQLRAETAGRPFPVTVRASVGGVSRSVTVDANGGQAVERTVSVVAHRRSLAPWRWFAGAGVAFGVALVLWVAGRRSRG